MYSLYDRFNVTKRKPEIDIIKRIAVWPPKENKKSFIAFNRNNHGLFKYDPKCV